MYVRGKPTVDGFFATPVKHFGAPGIPSADEIIRVTVFPTTSIEVHAEQPGGVISPDLLDRWDNAVVGLSRCEGRDTFVKSFCRTCCALIFLLYISQYPDTL